MSWWGQAQGVQPVRRSARLQKKKALEDARAARKRKAPSPPVRTKKKVRRAILGSG